MMKQLFFSTLLIFLTSCSEKIDLKYEKKIAQWQNEREEGLKKDYGWLSLIGLDWLQEGVNTVGSAPDSTVKLPSSLSGHLGHYLLKNKKVQFIPKVEGFRYLEKELRVGQSYEIGKNEKNEFLEYKSLRLFLIERSKGLGIRIKDSMAPTLTEFKGLQWHSIDPKFLISAQYKVHESPRNVSVPDVLGSKNDWESPGFVEFKLDGKTQKLLALKSGKGLFFIFRDSSSDQKKSYPSGRFYYYDGPLEEQITLDFNKAYNPPCAYTKYATCPLPPFENHLEVGLYAGEAYEK